MTSVTLVGVDCASDPANVGLAFGVFDGLGTTVHEACRGSRSESPLDMIADRLGQSDSPILLAMDAPLGWPQPMAEALAEHRAGDPLVSDANTLFRRYTDLFAWRRIGKRPLDVGAERIARTAHAALRLLEGLRLRLNREITLAWSPEFTQCRAIEVYPAGTLTAHGIASRGYKAKEGAAARHAILRQVSTRITVDTDVPDMARGSDVLDAVICLLSAHDFLTGAALPPPPDCPAFKEGWIWIRAPVKSRWPD